ncbi:MULTISPECIES: FecR family protein [Delftia]|uniref:FecR family protein n=1 Tax=Delftia TaxID=80865 RepID=UPI000F81E609|nr:MULTISPECIES: FecR domain-containing protein [Delftia]MDH0849006.1 FecR domain-containing protein [Delftia tsuruhatensis]WEL99437.1 FecR domain-containing protein [Delftia tsuruhatensis]WQM82400.1 FecR domain-containing protein [Delftia tsuruhatensis]
MSNELPPGVSPQELVGLHDRAADWFVRRQQPDWTGADERALDAWLGAHPLHRSIFEGMSRHWHGAPQLRELFPDEFGAAVPPAAPAVCAAPAAAPPRQRVLARWPGRPAAALSVLAVVSLLAWGGWYRWDHTPGYTLQARTAPGQTQSIELPDGSRVALNVDSELQVRYYPRRREVVLDRGEAFFEVTPGPDRPFTVDSGASRVRVVGTAFNVRAGPPRLVVKVLEGKVQLRPERDRAGGDVLLLAAGAGVAVDGAGRHSTVVADADSVGDWRTGQVRFSGTPLAEVAQELSRYLGAPVELGDESLGRLRVSGLLATATPERFVRALPALIAVRVQPRNGGGWLIVRG